MSITFDLIKTLPSALSSHIFSYLSCADLVSCREISWEWRHLANDSAHWTAIAQSIATSAFVSSLTLRQLQLFVRSRTLPSNVEILNKIADFSSKVMFGQNGVFICFLGSGAELENITLEIQGNRRSLLERVDIRQTHLACALGNGQMEGPIPNIHPYASHIHCPRYVVRSQVLHKNSLGSRSITYQVNYFRAVLIFPARAARTELEDRISYVMIRRLVSFHEEFDSRCVIG